MEDELKECVALLRRKRRVNLFRFGDDIKPGGLDAVRLEILELAERLGRDHLGFAPAVVLGETRDDIGDLDRVRGTELTFRPPASVVGDFVLAQCSGIPRHAQEKFDWQFERLEVADVDDPQAGRAVLGGEGHLFGDFRERIGVDPLVSKRSAVHVDMVVNAEAAAELGLAEGIKISYRAGDQPNNALSLNVLNPGEIATTAGTSGVVYGVSGEVKYDPLSRVNTFAHVNHTDSATRLGVLLCINGTGILNSWLNKYVGNQAFSYAEMNNKAATVPIGSEGLCILPFGNGSERVLQNKNIGAQISGLGFNTHTDAHLFRAAQEGIVFSFKYGMEIMEGIGIRARVIRAGKANMFLSPVFRETLAGVTGATIELYDTDGSIGAARGAGIGSGYYASAAEAFAGLQKLETVMPENSKKGEYEEAYQNWKKQLNKQL